MAKLKAYIKSFSYKSGYPSDSSSHGGGFVFDCRGLPNPGREAQYKTKTGKDSEVIEYFKERPVIEEFLSSCKSLVDISVKTYIDRDFDYLSINFGCTGGQHRSVYCAEILAVYLKQTYEVDVELEHTNFKNLSFL